MPTFLPSLLDLDGEWDEVLSILYGIFERDFKLSTTFHAGFKVLYNTQIKEDGMGKEEGFWHVICVDDKNCGGRIPDFPRAKRLPWAKPLMESPPRPEIKTWNYKEGKSKEGIRTYVWLENYDYALILQRKKTVFYWVTAFYVRSNWKRRDLQQKYENRV